MLVSAIQRQEVRSDTISSSDVQQNQHVSSSSTANAAMQMQQQQHQMIGSGGVQIVPFVNTDGSIQPINLVPQQLSVSSMQQFQMLQQNQYPYMGPQQYSSSMQMHGSKPHVQVQAQQGSVPTHGLSTPPIANQQNSFQTLHSQQMRHASQQPQAQQINNQLQQPPRAQGTSTIQPPSIRPIQQSQPSQGQQTQAAQVGGPQQQSAATIAQEQQSRYSQSIPAPSQVATQISTTPTPAAQTPLPQAAASNLSSQTQSLISNSSQQQTVTSSSHIIGTREQQGSSGTASQPNTTPHQPLQPTYYFAPQPTYPVIPGVNENPNAVGPTQWPQIQAMAYLPHQGNPQLIHTSQAGVPSIPTSGAGDRGNTLQTENRQPAVAAHAFHHYQNGSPQTHIPHQLVLVPQPQNFTYLPHSGGHLPLTAYHQAAGLHNIPSAAGFSPLQPSVGQTSTSSPTPSAVSQQNQQIQSQEQSASTFTQPLQQVPHQPVTISGVKMGQDPSVTVVTSAHAHAVPTHTTNQTVTATGHQQAMSVLPHAVAQMQSQYQQPIHPVQPINQQLGLSQNAMISGHQQPTPLPMGSVIHATAAQSNMITEVNDRGISVGAIDSPSMTQQQVPSNIQSQPVQPQLSASSQPIQFPGSN